MSTLGTLLGTLAVVVSTAACAPQQGARSGPTPYDAPTLVEVTNYNWADMTVYVMRGAMRARLGTVVTNQTQVFRLPRSMDPTSGSVRLLADPIGGFQTYDSGPILVMPGQRVSLALQNHLSVSAYSVWDR